MTRAIMTRDELAAHKTASHGRDHLRSGAGYDDMELAEARKWHAVSGWGRDGWDLGDWPYVVIYTRTLTTCAICGANLTDGSGDGDNGHWQNCKDPVGRFQVMQIVEGDHDAYAFTTAEDRDAAIDYMFLWYAAGQRWAPLGYEDRAALDAGEFDVDPKWRGPFR